MTKHFQGPHRDEAAEKWLRDWSFADSAEVAPNTASPGDHPPQPESTMDRYDPAERAYEAMARETPDPHERWIERR